MRSDAEILLSDVACGNVTRVIRKTERANKLLLAEVMTELLSTMYRKRTEDAPLDFPTCYYLYWQLSDSCGRLPPSLSLTHVLVPIAEERRKIR